MIAVDVEETAGWAQRWAAYACLGVDLLTEYPKHDPPLRKAAHR